MKHKLIKDFLHRNDVSSGEIERRLVNRIETNEMQRRYKAHTVEI